MYFFENKIPWHLVYENGAYSCINIVHSCGIPIKEFLRRQWVKTEDSLIYKKIYHWDSSKIPEIKPYITSASLLTFTGKVGKKVDLEVKHTQKWV